MTRWPGTLAIAILSIAAAHARDPGNADFGIVGAKAPQQQADCGMPPPDRRPDPRLSQVPGMSDIKGIFAVWGVTAIRRDGDVLNWSLARSCARGNELKLTEVRDKRSQGSVALAEGGHGVAFLRPDGSVWEWSNPWYNPPAQQLADATRIAAGYGHTLALGKDGAVWAWGVHGDCGEGGAPLAEIRDRQPRGFLPRAVKGIDSVTAISAGKRVSVALRSDGTVWWWGNLTSSDSRMWNYNIQFCRSEPRDPNPSPEPQPVPQRVASLQRVVAIASGHMHHLALTRDGAVWAWGLNDCGQLGFDPPRAQPPGDVPTWSVGPFVAQPVRVAGLPKIKAIAAGARHSLALGADGKVFTWGSDSHFQLDGVLVAQREVARWTTCTTLVVTSVGGAEPEAFRAAPAAVAGLEGVTAIAATPYRSIALKRDGTVWTWGAK
jgi:alpha-tubulin suppressor-like RCC1 family protein